MLVGHSSTYLTDSIKLSHFWQNAAHQVMDPVKHVPSVLVVLITKDEAVALKPTALTRCVVLKWT